ncbi:TauD/TfdA family dioxygenase [Actinomadura sp. 9N407]|uniref:TauD/TfdA family dioxygenase n=1 Tax=Actinomadura sp. 9N407 TaxID=3375154 RepID=UPI0037A3E180
MSQGLQASDDVGIPHPVGPDTPRVTARQLRQRGLVVLDGLTSRGDVLALAERIMDITIHRDSAPDGLTTIRDTGVHAGRRGFAGFTDQELAPHTERSSVPAPPRLMLLVCARPAGRGGECLLTDARAVHAELVANRPEAAARLSDPRTAFFGAGDGHATQVFTVHPDGRISVRLRLDGLARWSPMVQPYVRDLLDAVIAHQRPLRLAAGQGYVLDNTRWLHARNAFTGPRLCWRALGEPRFWLPTGFAPAPKTFPARRPEGPRDAPIAAGRAALLIDQDVVP